MKNLPLKSLDFTELKNAFKEFLKNDPTYKDFNFDASGISTLLNIFAYNSHIAGFYTKMMLDESFIDSAHTREAMLSHAKRTGYLPKGRRSARADVVLTIYVDEMPLSKSLTVARGSTFTATNSTQDTRSFYNIDDIILEQFENVIIEGVPQIKFTSQPFTIYEGSLDTYRFVVDASDITQRFVIKNRNVDIDTLKVNVFDAIGSTQKTEFQKADDVFELKQDSNVFFVTTNEEGYYQIFFGDGTFGVKLENGNMIEATYVSSSGESGNGAKSFIFNPSPGNFEDHEVETISVSSGGMEEETVESMRFTIPHHYRRQNRIVTESDYRSVLLSEFRNIDSINVWGGEKNARREYGKVFVSIKPKNADALTASARNEIKNSVIEKFGIVGVDVVFVDPEFVDVDVTFKARVDYKKTNRTKGQIENLIIQRASEFNQTELNQFGSILSDVALLDYVRDGEDAFISIYSTKTLRKKYKMLQGSTTTHIVTFGNELKTGINSNDLDYAGTICQLKDENGQMYLFNKSTGEKFVQRSFGTIDYSKGTISFNLPIAVRVVGYEQDAFGVVEFTATPMAPDIETNLNNIVRIAQIRVSA